MRYASRTAVGFAMLTSLLIGGCDRPPKPPKTLEGDVPEVLVVPRQDNVERTAVTRMERARANYEYRLEVLREYFSSTGQMDKYAWAGRELENLHDAKTFIWENIPEIVPPTGESVEDADERALVEYAVAARRQYLAAAEELAEFYEQRDANSYKAQRIRNMQARFDPIRTYQYYLEAEIPGPELRCMDVIPEANQMYDQAVRLFRSGRGFMWVATDYDKLRQAVGLFRELVWKYPRSTKIAMSAYYLGEIYKEYFAEYVRAAHWYERAFQWDMHITEPARFQAATVHDIWLHNPARAIELYDQSLRFDPWRLGNSETAERRIRELTEQLEAQAAQPAPRPSVTAPPAPAPPPAAAPAPPTTQPAPEPVSVQPVAG